MEKKLKVLHLDIENFPAEAWIWDLGDQHVSLDFLKRDWNICAWAASWDHEDKVHYMDNRGRRNIYDDKRLVKALIKLINQADIIIGQNIDHFDIRKLATRAEFHKLKPFKPCKTTDILTEERRVFAHTSHTLAYKSERNLKYKKLKHEKYPKLDLWIACMEDKLDAWKVMEEYCIHDVKAAKERYHGIKPWIRTHHVIAADGKTRCKCGSTRLRRKGYAHTDAGKFQIYSCKDCGKWPRSPINLLTKRQKSARLREAQ